MARGELASLAALAFLASAAAFPERARGGDPPPPGDPLEAALALAAELDPAHDPAPARAAAEQATQALLAELVRAGSHQARAEALARAVHRTLGIAPEEDPALQTALPSLLPAQVLARRRGACLGLSLWYLALGRRAGLDVVGVALPGHFFVRLREGGAALNLETTLGGALRDEAWYRARFGLAPEGPAPGNYLRDLRPDEVQAEVLNNVGGALLAGGGQAARACGLLERAVALAPEDPDAHYDLALARREAGRAAEALQAVERALALHPRSREALNLRGLLRLDARPDLAQADFAAALELAPGEARYACNRGLARQRLGDLAGAAADLERALALRPGWDEARRALALVRLERGEAGPAAEELAALPRDPRAALLRAVPGGPAGRDMLAALVTAAEPRWPAVAAAGLLEQAARDLRTNHAQRAKAACERALALREADQVLAWCLRGLACEALGDETWAKRSFVLAMDAGPRDPRGFRHMADHYLRRDRLAVAAEYLRGWLERAPRDAPDRAEVEALVEQVEAGKRGR